MPTYQYACTACGEQLEVVQSISDAALTECPACEGQLRKVFSAVGIVFKGSGFYRTDSREKAGAAAGKDGANDSSAAKADGKKTDDKAATGSTGSGGSGGSSGSSGSGGSGSAGSSSGASTSSSSSSSTPSTSTPASSSSSSSSSSKATPAAV